MGTITAAKPRASLARRLSPAKCLPFSEVPSELAAIVTHSHAGISRAMERDESRDDLTWFSRRAIARLRRARVSPPIVPLRQHLRETSRSRTGGWIEDQRYSATIFLGGGGGAQLMISASGPVSSASPDASQF